MENQNPTPSEHHAERHRDDKSDTLRYEFSKGYVPMENPKHLDGEITDIQ
ncbi:MAG: hypothetical protein WCC10_09910 [Tumebacillaceae bacterium]